MKKTIKKPIKKDYRTPKKQDKPEMNTEFKEEMFVEHPCQYRSTIELHPEEARKLNVIAKHFNTAKVEVLRTLVNECYKQLFDTKAGEE